MRRWMSANCVVIVLLSLGLAHAEPKIEELVIAPADKVIGLAISPAGLHSAAVMNKGSRFCVSVDGVEGPKLDQMLDLAGRPYAVGPAPIVFSDDGSRWAYLAKVGDEFVVFADGKELIKMPFRPTGVPGPLRFAANSTLLTVTFMGPNGGQIVYVNDKPGPTGATTSEVVFTPDGTRYAYTGMEADGKTKWAVVDGRQVKYIGEKLKFTSNGHLVGIADGANGQAMVIDGKPMMVAAQISPVWISPTGVIIAAQVIGKKGGPPMLVIDGKPVAGTEGLTIAEVVFSPDGKRYAALCANPKGGMCIFVDGKKQQDYTSISRLRFSPDSTKVIYQAQTNQTFLVVNDEESDGYGMIEEAICAGQHLGFLAAGKDYMGKYVVINGKATKRQYVAQLSLSSDGARNAYISEGAGGNHCLWVDGAEVKGFTALAMSTLLRDPDPAPGQVRQASKTMFGGSVVFSPDGKHFASLGSVPAKGNYVFLDGKPVGPTKMPSLNWAAFTTDSKHLVWVDESELFIDGKSVLKYQGTPTDNVVGNFTMQADGSLGLIAKVGDSYKRLKITPDPAVTVDTLLGAAN